MRVRSLPQKVRRGAEGVDQRPDVRVQVSDLSEGRFFAQILANHMVIGAR